MKCPRCQSVFSAAPDAAGTVVCTSCGVRLRARGTADEPRTQRQASARRGRDVESELEGLVGPAPAATLDAPRPPAEPSARMADGAVAEAIRQVLGEIRLLRKAQQQMLALLQAQHAQEPLGDDAFDDDGPPSAGRSLSPPPPVRSRRRKSVLIIDDDDRTRQEAVEALQAAEVPVHAVADGNSGLAAIASERPDVIVLELGITGAMAGKDVINVIKATMELVDIPIVLYTRVPIEGQKEARQVHGADELVIKTPTSVESLVLRIIALFRRG